MPGDRHVLAGLKDGKILIIDVAAGDILEEIPAHTTEAWTVCLQPDLVKKKNNQQSQPLLMRLFLERLCERWWRQNRQVLAVRTDSRRIERDFSKGLVFAAHTDAEA